MSNQDDHIYALLEKIRAESFSAQLEFTTRRKRAPKLILAIVQFAGNMYARYIEMEAERRRRWR